MQNACSRYNTLPTLTLSRDCMKPASPLKEDRTILHCTCCAHPAVLGHTPSGPGGPQKGRADMHTVYIVIGACNRFKFHLHVYPMELCCITQSSRAELGCPCSGQNWKDEHTSVVDTLYSAHNCQSQSSPCYHPHPSTTTFQLPMSTPC